MNNLIAIYVVLLLIFQPFLDNITLFEKVPTTIATKVVAQASKINYKPPFEGYKFIEVDGGDLSRKEK